MRKICRMKHELSFIMVQKFANRVQGNIYVIAVLTGIERPIVAILIQVELESFVVLIRLKVNDRATRPVFLLDDWIISINKKEGVEPLLVAKQSFLCATVVCFCVRTVASRSSYCHGRWNGYR
jgi:hypothetical protein